MGSCTVRFALLPARNILNLASPRYLPEIMQRWGGKRSYFDRRYDALRDEVEKVYVDEFNRRTGHFAALVESIRREGIRNPIITSTMRPKVRSEDHVPPWFRGRPEIVICDYLGGSRLYAANLMALNVPCIVNDYAGSLPMAEPLASVADVAARFMDAPRVLHFDPDGSVYANELPFVHFHEHQRYSMSAQVVHRRGVVERVMQVVDDWLAYHDR